MERVLEPELMDDEQQAIAYARADFSRSNQWFVDHVIADYPEYLRTVIDLGCGSGDVLIRLVRAWSDIHITAVDGSAAMIALTRQAVQESGFEQQIHPLQGYIPGLRVGEHHFDAILSKDFLHHLPNPGVLWSEVKRLGRPGAAVYVMDLFRPDTPDEARRIVESVAANEALILKQDFYNSMCAAFTVEEIRGQLQSAQLDLAVAQVSERHMLIHGRLP